MEYVGRLKVLLGVHEQDELLHQIIDIIKSKMLFILKANTIPVSLEWILVELCVRRFNRIGSEGVSSESVDGKSVSYEDDLKEYQVYFDKYIEDNSIKKGYRLL